MGRAAAGLIAALLAVCPAAGAGGERILSFHSEITVRPDGQLIVTETIKVRAARVRIKRGIYRDFPVLYRGRGWLAYKVPFKVLRVLRDGKPEAWHTEKKGKYVRVYIGRRNVFLRPGVYTYSLTYRTANLVGSFQGHDELYWNVTGDEWEFPIDRASATVILPAGVPRQAVRLKAYTGKRGGKGRDYTARLDAAGRAVFATTRPLRKGEGLTIVVGFSKGFVAELPLGEQLKGMLLANVLMVVGLGGLAVVSAYYLFAWLRVGRDPPKGVIIPLFEPPEGLSPAAVRYVLHMGYDHKCLSAAIISMAVKGYVTIEEDDGDYTLVRREDADEQKLSPDEQKVARKLLGHLASVELDNTNCRRFQKAIAGLKKVLAQQYRGRYFFSNLSWFIVGAALSVLTVAGIGVAAFLADGTPAVGFLAVWLSMWSVGVFFLLRQVFAAWRAVRRGTGTGRPATTGGALGITLFAVPFCIAKVVVLGFLVYMTSIWLLPILLLLGLLNVRFHYYLKRPTVEGRKVMDQIEGFRMYLATAEQDRLAEARPPERTPELFERYLPYAVALEVESRWAEQFGDVLARAGEEGYSPSWYAGAALGTIGAVGVASGLGTTLGSALASAATAPGSSSGFGGGSSGGGGGGGGGGGW